MMDKKRSLLRAVLGAYVLLRANELDGMDLWTSNLVSWFPWLPDALALRVEYLARDGEHAAALKLLPSDGQRNMGNAVVPVRRRIRGKAG